MALELATYGAVAGLMHQILPRKLPFLYCALLTAMLAGRLVWGGAMFLCLGFGGTSFSFSAFLAGAFTNAIPGIVLQILLIPFLVMLLERHKLLHFPSADKT